MSTERERLAESADPKSAWRQWGPYVSARQWGTVREDYSADGNAWEHFPFDDAHRRAYRWGEDGLSGLCDVEGYLNLGLALWNGQDDRIKERLFGLTNPQGNHGEDVKEYWWALDGTPTHSFARWLYRYPTTAFPYADLLAVNAARGPQEPEYELSDTGVLDDTAFFDVEVTHAKASPSDICVEITATNHSQEAAPLDLVPQLWFRNTWAWGLDDRRPRLWAEGALRGEHDGTAEYADVRAHHHELGRMRLRAERHEDAGLPDLVFCDNDSDLVDLYGQGASQAQDTAYPKDVVNEAVLAGDVRRGDPERQGTKVGVWWHFDAVHPGQSVTVRLRLTDLDGEPEAPESFDAVLSHRRQEADAFFADVLPTQITDEDAHIARRAFAGLQWGKQLYLYDVPRWLAGDPAQPPPPPERAELHRGRNTDWQHVNLAEVISMPDEWEYPWFATWDLAFHCVALAHVDPAFAKAQLLLICREWSMHP
ncbi:MAG: glucosidase, partial [Ornithinimicrobium sp.]